MKPAPVHMAPSHSLGPLRRIAQRINQAAEQPLSRQIKTRALYATHQGVLIIIQHPSYLQLWNSNGSYQALALMFFNGLQTIKTPAPDQHAVTALLLMLEAYLAQPPLSDQCSWSHLYHNQDHTLKPSDLLHYKSWPHRQAYTTMRATIWSSACQADVERNWLWISV